MGFKAVSFKDFIREYPCVSVANNAFDFEDPAVQAACRLHGIYFLSLVVH